MRYKTKQGIRKLDKDTYLVLKTGEVRDYKQNDEKQAAGLRETFHRLEGLIRTNFAPGDEAQGFMTLTYRENMKDPEKLMKDFGAFWKRLCRAFPEKKLEYLSVAEPQGRGAWHLHILVKDTTGSRLYIDNKRIAKIWGHGSTDMQRLKGDDVGKYYKTYFTDLNLEIAGNTESEKEQSKAAKKGSRLKLYPKGFRFYRRSRGIVNPEIEAMSREQFNQKYPVLKSDASYDIVDAESGETINRIERTLRSK